jgi:hypothetical protein
MGAAPAACCFRALIWKTPRKPDDGHEAATKWRVCMLAGSGTTHGPQQFLDEFAWEREDERMVSLYLSLVQSSSEHSAARD